MIKVIHTTQGVSKIEFDPGMTAADVISAAGMPVPGPDTAIKVRRDGARIELLADNKVQDGDVISMAKSADGGRPVSRMSW